MTYNTCVTNTIRFWFIKWSVCQQKHKMHHAKCRSLKDFKTCWNQIMSFKCIKWWPWNAVELISSKSKIFIVEIWGASKAWNLPADIQDEIKSFLTKVTTWQTWGERRGSVVECRTPEREVGGSKPTAAVLCPWARHFPPPPPPPESTG